MRHKKNDGRRAGKKHGQERAGDGGRGERKGARREEEERDGRAHVSEDRSRANKPPRKGATKIVVPDAATLRTLPKGSARTWPHVHLDGASLDQSQATKYKPAGTASMTPSVPLKKAGEAALPGVIGSDAPKEVTDSQRPLAHMKRSLEESAKATELPSNIPPKAD